MLVWVKILVGYGDVLFLTYVTDVNVDTFEDEGQQEQGNDDEDGNDNKLDWLHCFCCELLKIDVIQEVKMNRN